MLKVEGLSKHYLSGRGRVLALDNISVSLEESETLAVVGKSGSGKTTLLYCVGGLEAPDAGRVVCCDVALHSLGPRRLARFVRANLGFVFQSSNLLSYLSVYDNIAFPMHLNRAAGPDIRLRVAELLERVGLPSAGPARPHELSGGELQRVAFARAVAHRPKLLIADEPTASLDSENARQLVALMSESGAAEKRLTLVATHDLELTNIATCSLHLRDGRRA